MRIQTHDTPNPRNGKYDRLGFEDKVIDFDSTGIATVDDDAYARRLMKTHSFLREAPAAPDAGRPRRPGKEVNTE